MAFIGCLNLRNGSQLKQRSESTWKRYVSYYIHKMYHAKNPTESVIHKFPHTGDFYFRRFGFILLFEFLCEYKIQNIVKVNSEKIKFCKTDKFFFFRKK